MIRRCHESTSDDTARRVDAEIHSMNKQLARQHDHHGREDHLCELVTQAPDGTVASRCVA